MKQATALAILLLVGQLAYGSDLADAARAARARRQATQLVTPLVTLKVRQSQAIPVAGASAAWAIDSSIVDVSVQGGQVVLLARSAGRTKVMILGSAGDQTLEVLVEAAPPSLPAATKGPANHAAAEVRYSSAAREIQNTVTVTRETATRKTEAQVRVVHQAGEPRGDRARTAIPSASYRIFTRRRELTLFDRDVEHSPLTLNNTPIRGLHYLDDSWRLHAGYTAYAAYRSFLIPVERQLVAGGGYRIRTGASSTLTPTFFAYDDEGTVASMLYAYDDRERLAWRAEVGYSRGLGAAGDLAFDNEKDRVRAEFRYRPDDFAAPAGSPKGFFSDASWSRAFRRGSTAALRFAASEFGGTRVLAASTDADHRLNDWLALTGGASWGSFGTASSLTIPAGVRVDLPRGSFGALYRYSHSKTNDGGHGFRLSARGSVGSFYASAYADRQRNVPTIDVIFSERPDLALALDELGISATSAADIVRALRQHAELADLGFIEGITLDLAPMRTQFGFEAAWLGRSEARHQLRARLVRSVVESVSRRTASTLGTLSYARRLSSSTDLFASYSYWRTERRDAETQVQPFFEVGVRQRFDSLPAFLDGKGSISGQVFVDEDLDGRSDGAGVAALVELDGARTEATGRDGSFRFAGVAGGTHRVTVRVPDRPDAYFTTASKVEAQIGDRIVFGVATTPAWVNGSVRSDGDAGIAGVRVLLTRGANQIVATTASDGGFSMVAPPGEWQLSILTDSLPAGFSAAGTESRAVHLERAKPLSQSFTLRAHRSIIGSGASPNAVIQVHPLAKTIQADGEGRFALRSLPPGEVTLVSGERVQKIFIPEAPGAHQINLAQVAVLEAPLPVVETKVVGERRATMEGFVVQIGAYRVRANAVESRARAVRSGVAATLESSGPLTIVRAGPYRSREEASATVAALTRDGIDAVVLSTN